MKIIDKAVIGLILFYRKYISPLKKPCCRFYPSCSQYAVMAIEKYGVLRGGFKAVLRILRCNPLFKGGIDFP